MSSPGVWLSGITEFRPARRAVRIGAHVAVLGLVAILAAAGCSDGEGDTEGILVPIRWCVLAGSSEAQGKESGDLLTTHRVDGDTLGRANDIWSSARIVFVSIVVEDDNGQKGVPVIEDPNILDGDAPGDVDGDRPIGGSEVASACDAAWDRLSPESQGIVVITARRFGTATAALGGASKPAFALWVEQPSQPLTGHRGDDMCGEPRALRADDVYDLDGLGGFNVGWVVLAEPEAASDPRERGRHLAHELGHLLFLSHGNGLDDDSNGEDAGSPGPRRFDAYCDPRGLGNNGMPAEDAGTTGTGCDVTSSVMNAAATCPNLRHLQIEQARAVARLLPGCKGVECA